MRREDIHRQTLLEAAKDGVLGRIAFEKQTEDPALPEGTAIRQEESSSFMIRIPLPKNMAPRYFQISIKELR